ncbi:MAG: hypothetical protein H7X74_01005 [Methyloceanibacter sp.]|nr:hypothetical protein [Methyloceanibacter sp.]
MLNEVVRYFDLYSQQRSATPKGVTAAPRMKHDRWARAKHASVLPQYAAVAAGVLVDPLLRSYTDSETFNFDFWSLLARAGFALLMAILLLPAVYKNAFDPDKPISSSSVRCLRRGSAGSPCSNRGYGGKWLTRIFLSEACP